MGVCRVCLQSTPFESLVFPWGPGLLPCGGHSGIPFTRAQGMAAGCPPGDQNPLGHDLSLTLHLDSGLRPDPPTHRVQERGMRWKQRTHGWGVLCTLRLSTAGTFATWCLEQGQPLGSLLPLAAMTPCGAPAVGSS